MAHGMQEYIRRKLEDALKPSVLEIINDSARHHGHGGDDGSGESHFTVQIASPAFQGKSRLETQRMVMDVLKEELQSGRLHALSIKTSR
jgi:BolA protein